MMAKSEKEKEGIEEETAVETPPEPSVEEIAALKGAAVKDQEVEEAVRKEEMAQVEEIRGELDVKLAEKPDLQKTPEELFETMLRPKIPEIIEAWGLMPVINQCQSILSKAKEKNRAKYEKKAVKTLIQAFHKNKIPFKKWVFFPESMINEKAVNCSGATLVFGVVMNEHLGIKTEHVNPSGHAANLVTYSDNSTQYVDARNQVVHDLKLEEPIGEEDGFRIYKVKKRGLEFQLLPVASMERASVLTFLGNVRELKKDQATDPEADMTVNQYGEGLDFAFADEYTKDKFLATRENDPMWIKEKEDKELRRKRQDRFLVGKLF